jgi:hypothetical protein
MSVDNQWLDLGACLRKGLPHGLKKLTMDNPTRTHETASLLLDCGQSSLERLVETNPCLGQAVLGISLEGKEKLLTQPFSTNYSSIDAVAEYPCQ